jgi:hypothetical protein
MKPGATSGIQRTKPCRHHAVIRINNRNCGSHQPDRIVVKHQMRSIRPESITIILPTRNAGQSMRISVELGHLILLWMLDVGCWMFPLT